MQDGENHVLLELKHNPLQSSYNQGDHLNPFAVYDDLDNSNSEDLADDNCRNITDLGCSSGEDFNPNRQCEDQVYLPDLVGGNDNTHGQCSTAVSKLQIRLNNVINN
jgi:hypothetical protein